VVHREQPLEVLFQLGVVQLLVQGLDPHVLRHLAQQDLQECAGGGCRGLRSQLDDVEDLPVEGVREEQMPVQLRQIPDFVGLVLINRMEMLHEALNEVLLKQIVDLAEPLRQQSKELLVDALHHAALDDHVAQFVLVPFRDVRL
jgi:hypothetical protein